MSGAGGAMRRGLEERQEPDVEGSHVPYDVSLNSVLPFVFCFVTLLFRASIGWQQNQAESRVP